MSRAEGDHFDADDFAGGDNVPELAGDDEGGEKIEVSGGVGLFGCGHAAHGGDVVDAGERVAHGDGFDLNAGKRVSRSSLLVSRMTHICQRRADMGHPPPFQDEVVGRTIAEGLGDDEAAAEGFGGEAGLGPFALEFGVGEIHLATW